MAFLLILSPLAEDCCILRSNIHILFYKKDKNKKISFIAVKGSHNCILHGTAYPNSLSKFFVPLRKTEDICRTIFQ